MRERASVGIREASGVQRVKPSFGAKDPILAAPIEIPEAGGRTWKAGLKDAMAAASRDTQACGESSSTR